jgi:ketosteroid isomerase-like protein
MRMHTCVSFWLLVAWGLPVHAQQSSDKKGTLEQGIVTTATGPADAKQQLLDLGEEWVAAEMKHDANILRRILDDKFVASFGAKKPYDKESFIKLICRGDVDPTESQTLTDETVIVDGDTAVVVGTDTLRGTKNGTTYAEVARYTVTYIHRQGHWVALAEHLVEVPQTM